jgi:hypothetical protein
MQATISEVNLKVLPLRFRNDLDQGCMFKLEPIIGPRSILSGLEPFSQAHLDAIVAVGLARLIAIVVAN